MGLEDRLKKFISERLSRGRVNIFVRSSGAAEPPPRLVLNRPLVNEFKRVLDELRKELGLAGRTGLGAFFGQPGLDPHRRCVA